MSVATNAPDLARREAAVLAAVPKASLIGAEWRAADGGPTLEVEDPSTGAALCELPDARAADALDALDAAAAAQLEWAATPARVRGELLRRSFEAVIARQEELALLITLEMGKPLGEARAEVAYGAEFLRWFSEEAARIGGRYADHPDGTGRILTRRHPVGPCILVTPWNFPLAMATRKIAPAIAAGCTMVVKPAKQTPLTTLLLARILKDAGLPPGVLNVLTTTGSGELVQALIADGRARKLSFTGSTEVGRVLLRLCAERVMRTSMELGGNAPLIVFDDADLDRAVEGALLAKLRNGGESCTATNRIYVQSAIADAFVSAFVGRMQAVRVGRGTGDVEAGPMIDQAGREKIQELVDDASGRGAHLLAGGHPLEGPGYFYAPTVLDDVPADARMLSEEIFGPVAPIVRFDDEEEAIAAANATEYGLVAYAFTQDLDRALRVTDRLDTGMVGINQGMVSNAAAPFGGIKHSGLGREGGPEGLEEYLTTKYVAIASPPVPPAMDLPATRG
ncbi:MAG TPA: NAD-dependent succinate-semialdehyde dehydrogenase [Solirubrobacteraceae bacterium]|jgi:succinate-semialdehyde dehydrogenase/glutarate-semialdehyde dehydrogenase